MENSAVCWIPYLYDIIKLEICQEQTDSKTPHFSINRNAFPAAVEEAEGEQDGADGDVSRQCLSPL